MRIVEAKSGREHNQVILYLSSSEMKELKDSLDILLESHDLLRHEHINDVTYRKEITVTHESNDFPRDGRP